MHQRTAHSSTAAHARRIRSLTPLAALACVVGCNGDALNLGEDDPGAGDGTCNADVSSSGNLFALTQADVDALAGCRELGTLYIRVPEAEQETFSLAALSELEVVQGLLSIVGPLTSLHGLESLEQVAGLELKGLRAPDLTPLRSLERSLRGPQDARERGVVTLEDCDALTDLSGLENLTTWSSLRLIGLDGLITLDGLQAPPLVENVDISNAPQLRDITALSPVEHVMGIGLVGTAVETLGDLRLQYADSLFFRANPALTNLDGLAQLRRVGGLFIDDNDALLRIELPALGDFDALSVRGNAVLPVVPAYPVNTSRWYSPHGPVEGASSRTSRILFEVGENPQVTSIVLPTLGTDIEQLAIYQNASLTELDMGYLQRSKNIWLLDNAVLDNVSALSLDRVEDLAVMNNPALSVAQFADVQTFTREITGNLDEPAP